MKSSIEQLTINNEIVNSSRKGESHENGQENKSNSKNINVSSTIKTPDELRQEVKSFFKTQESLLKNTYLDVNGDLCFIRLKETQSTPIPFISLWNGYGPGKMYDPTAPQQRRDKQHPSNSRKQMLLSYIAKEDLGKFILMETTNGHYLIIDGRQRSSLINEFLSDKMVLRGVDATNFWKWFLNDQHLYKEGLSSDERLKCNKIIQTFIGGKTPSVVFSKLPQTIKDEIHYKFLIPCVIIDPVVYKMGTSITEVDKSLWDMEEIKDAITRKFIDINQFHKAIDKKDVIWGSKVDSVRLVRDFIEDKPILGQRFGYVIKDICEKDTNFCRLDDTNEVRKFMILITRSLLIYQKTIQWGASEGEVAKIAIDNIENCGDFTNQTKQVWRFWLKMLNDKLMVGNYMGSDGKPSMLEIPEEFRKSGSDILKLSYFLSTLYIMEMLLINNYGAHNNYIVSGEPTRKLFKLVEKVSYYLTLGKIANINHEDWKRQDLPLVKYDLGQEFFSTELFDGVEIGTLLRKVKDLNQHQKGLSKDSENTLKTLIKYSETKINQ